MQDRPLALPHVFHRAEQLFGHKPIVTATATGEVATTVADWAVRVRRLATALDSLGVPADGRVGTFMTGRYQMVNESGERFEIDVPTFSLDSPDNKRVLN